MILVTGGTGFIGSHTVCELIENGKEAVIVDNLSNSSDDVLDKIKKITGVKPAFVKGDLCDKALCDRLFKEYVIDSVIHFAGLKAVGESVQKPLEYYENNVYGTLNLLDAMRKNSVKKIVFSSSATVYGMKNTPPLKEDMPLSATNPYGRTKLFIEEILNDLYASDNGWSIVKLRYFNPVGAHPTGIIGEAPSGYPNNIMPVILRTAAGKIEQMCVFGADYDTPDGSCIRDYIHITDLAKGHIKALEYIEKTGAGCVAVNLGTGRGYSVFELIGAFERVTGKKVNYRVGERRKGDVAVCYADPTKAKELFGWTAEKGIDSMCEDAWRFQQNYGK